ncbi:hypothetical protein AMECASPLE_038447 [Ameca splendens]|uniref:Uncharacterized protein n=1 Tax=Ameca splendens TaxID=208324 RepID=A0ABV0ZT28_9TELE
MPAFCVRLGLGVLPLLDQFKPPQMWGLFPRWLGSLPAGILVVLGVRGWVPRCMSVHSPVAACQGLDPWPLSGPCLGNDMSRVSGSMDMLGHRRLPAGLLLQIPGASALWLLGGSPGTLPCSSLGGLR